MTADPQGRDAVAPTAEAIGITMDWGWFLALGIVQVLAGALAVGFVFSATLASVVALGVLLLIAGSTQMAAALLARRWDGFFLFLLHGFLYGVAGFLTLEHPLLAGEGLTLMLAPLFLLVGLYRIAVALIENLPARGWLVFNGVVAVLLGVAFWRQWPESGLWVLGMLVGIEIIVNGVTWSVLAVGVRNELVLMTGRTLVRTQDEDQ